MITAETTTAAVGFASCEIAHRRFMERERFMLWQNYIAASNLYMAMLNKPLLFDEDETDAQYETCRNLEDSHNALDQTYHRLYLTDGTEQD